MLALEIKMVGICGYGWGLEGNLHLAMQQRVQGSLLIVVWL